MATILPALACGGSSSHLSPGAEGGAPDGAGDAQPGPTWDGGSSAERSGDVLSRADASACGACTSCGAGLVVLACGQSSPIGVAVDGTSAYWINSVANGSVMKVPVGGGAPVALATMQRFPLRLAIDSTSVYWTTGSAVSKVALAGGAVTTLYAASVGTLFGVAVDATSVYFTDNGYTACPPTGAVYQLPLAGGTPTALGIHRDHPGAIAADATTIAWADGFTSTGPGMVEAIEKGVSGALAADTMLAQPFDVALDATNIYWTDEAPATSPPQGRVMMIPKSGVGGATTATVLAGGQDLPTGIAVDATTVYWTDAGDGTVKKAPIGGGSITTLATGPGDPTSIAVDAASVYWSDSAGGTIMKLTPK